VTRAERVEPPADLAEDCAAPPAETIGAVIERLAGLVRCEQAKNAATRAWSAEK